MRGITVCVEYYDILEMVLPSNLKHFEDYMIVTTPKDSPTIELAQKYGVKVYTTNVFYDRGAYFNKWAALEEGLNFFGKHGLMCIMDADILWPSSLPATDYKHGFLYTPRRRVWPFLDKPLPSVDQWSNLKLSSVGLWSGYTQIFWADDPSLSGNYWYTSDWKSAGGGDTLFQNRWPKELRARPNWEVLHIGPIWSNWCGRVTPLYGKSRPANASARVRWQKEIANSRKKGPVQGIQFYHERLHDEPERES